MRVINNLGNEYKGTLGKAVTAASWKGRNYFKKYFKPANPKTALQTEVRNTFRAAVAGWQAFNAKQKAAYDWYNRYHKLRLSPFNAKVGSHSSIVYGGDAYVAPPVAEFVVDDGVNPIEAALPTIKKQGQTTIYAYGLTDDDGKVPWSLPAEDENYDIYILKEGYEDYLVLDQTVVLTMDTHSMTAL